jgi:hypothetical protein
MLAVVVLLVLQGDLVAQVVVEAAVYLVVLHCLALLV